jgi:vacuolar-type H+-ATPase subunit E/Vma4
MAELKEEIKAELDAIRSKAGAEIAEKIEDNLISIVTKTNSHVTLFKERESEVKELRAEAYAKRHALKEYQSETQSKIQDYEDRIKTFESDNSNEKLTKEIERLRGFEQETIESQRSDFKSFVEGVKDNEKFSKVSSRFKLPVKDNKIDFEGFADIDYNDLKSNITTMKDLQELEYFDYAHNNNSAPPSGGKAQRGTDASFNERMRAAKTPREIAEIIKSEGVI